MAKPGPKKRYDDHIGFPIQSEYLEVIDKIADRRNTNRANVARKILQENLEDYVDKNDEQLSLTEDLEQNGI
ncbi:MAG: hypothetical protein ABEH43_11965 [Flavobacteriales bacterium]